MEPHIYFSYGVTKSASTLAFQLAREALVQAGFDQPALPAHITGGNKKINAVAHLSQSDVWEVLDQVQTLGHPLVLKTHTRPDPAVVHVIEAGLAQAHATFRDPRDVALSMMDHGQRARAKGKPAFAEIKSLEDAARGIAGQLDSLSAWLQLPGVIPLDFPTLTRTPKAAARMIATQIGLEDKADDVVDTVLNHRFIQFNLGLQNRHEAEMDKGHSDRFQAIFADFYDGLSPCPPPPAPGKAVLPPGTDLKDMDKLNNFRSTRRPDGQETVQ